MHTLVWFALPAERNSRVQEQTLALKRVGEDLVTMAQKMDAEKVARWVICNICTCMASRHGM